METIIVGGFLETIELCEENSVTIIGIIDNENTQINNYTYLGTDKDAPVIFSNLGLKKVLISPDHPTLRERLVNYYKEIGFEIFNLISNDAKISRYSRIKEGVIIQAKTYISANTEIGNYVRINIGANVMHDSHIGDFTTVAPNAVILGRVKIGRNCYIGANSTILPNIEIGDYCTIGAGAVVTKNIQSNKTVKGVPAK
jgi:sugar O-acyltransferase (sialic acid O-acetyltransferase NeuD family)